MRTLAALLVLAAAAPAFADAAAPPATPARARIAAAEKVYHATRAGYEAAMRTLDEVYVWSTRWYAAERDAGVATAAASHLARMRELAPLVQRRVAAGVSRADEVDAAAYYVAEAEAWAAKR